MSDFVRKSIAWLQDKRGDIFLHAIVVTGIIWVLEHLGRAVVEPGPIRDIGFYVLCLGAIAGSCFLIANLSRIPSRPAISIPLVNDIRSALYGVGRKRTDVKYSFLKQLNDKGMVQIGNNLGDDPAPNEHKDLQIDFADGSVRSLPEGSFVILFDSSSKQH